MSLAIQVLTKEQVLAYRSYYRKRRAGKLSEVTPEELEARRVYNEFRNKLNPLRKRYTDKKGNAKHCGHEFTITFEDFVSLCSQTTHCPVLGCELDYSVYHGKGLQHNAASLDRIDNSRGYVPGNVWIISRRANSMKHDANLEELKLLVSALEARLTDV